MGMVWVESHRQLVNVDVDDDQRHIKSQRVRKVQNDPPYLSKKKKNQVDNKRKDMGQTTMFNKNIISLTCCTIIKMYLNLKLHSLQ